MGSVWDIRFYGSCKGYLINFGIAMGYWINQYHNGVSEVLEIPIPWARYLKGDTILINIGTGPDKIWSG